MILLNLLQSIFAQLPVLAEMNIAHLGAALAVLTGTATSIGQALIGMKAVEAVGRQPEVSGKITVLMVIAQAVVETAAIYGLIIAFVLSGK